MKRVVRSWLIQQAHKRACTCPKWWQVEVWNALLMMWFDILDKED